MCVLSLGLFLYFKNQKRSFKLCYCMEYLRWRNSNRPLYEEFTIFLFDWENLATLVERILYEDHLET